MLKEELTKTGDTLPSDLMLAANAIEGTYFMSAYRVNILAQIIARRDDLRQAISEEMIKALQISLEYALQDLKEYHT